MTVLRRATITVGGALCIWLAPASLAQAACTTANPPANCAAGQAVQYGGLTTDQEIEKYFTGARAAEACNVPLALPAG